jgi:hypothetical protein
MCQPSGLDNNKGWGDSIPLQIGTILFSTNVMKNVIQQGLVMSGLYTPPKNTRLAAFEATLKFPRGTVGSGVNMGIQLIHAILGSFGQQRIGYYFHSPKTQRRMSQMVTSPWISENVETGRGEFHYWVKSLKCGFIRMICRPTPVNFSTFVGGVLGSMALTPFRAMLQFGFSQMQVKTGVDPRRTCLLIGFASAYAFVMAVYNISDHNGVVDSIDYPQDDPW